MAEANTNAPQQPPPAGSISELFQHETWREPWSSPDFPLDVSPMDRKKRFETKPWWSHDMTRDYMQRFIEEQAFRKRTWPWGFVIYRTTYSSDKDWAAALEKFNRYVEYPLAANRRTDEATRIVREGYRNVVIEDPALEGLIPRAIMKQHSERIDKDALPTGFPHPRTDYCLVMDEQCVQSILASSEPALAHKMGPIGYMNTLVMSYDPEDPENCEGPYYDGCMRTDLTAIFTLALNCDHRPLDELDPYVDDPDLVPYTDAHGICVNAPRSMLVHRWVYKTGGSVPVPWQKPQSVP